MTVGVIDYQTMKQNTLALTSWFETTTDAPATYGVTSGDWDNMGISFGAIQWNLGQGTLQPIWKYMFDNYYDKCLVAFNNDKGSLDYVKNLIENHPVSDQITWGNQITDWSSGVNGHGLVTPWKGYFSALGQIPECIAKQTDSAQSYFSNAESWKPLLGVWSRRGYALLFDIAVQKGNFPQGCIDQVNSTMSAQDFTGMSREDIETFRLQTIADKRTNYGDISTAAFEPFKERKTTIANGSGYMADYATNFDTTPYDAILEPAYQSDVAVTTTTTTTSTTTTTEPVTATGTSTTSTNNSDGTVTTTTTTTYSDGSQQTVSTTTKPLVMMKSFPISIDMESGVDKEIIAPFNQDDSNTVEVSFSFTQDGTVFDLTGLTPTLMVRKPDGTVLQLTAITITDLANGHCNIVLPSNANDIVGQYWCEIRLVDGAGDRLISEPFDYMVNEGYLHGTNSQATNTIQSCHTKFFN